ncbi:hypothetical protein [Edaphocola aurantiacus]|uniref:hypothetical protein n=1 Tax=Edaphocola aurantiacus TaxID=2601682 RepID=UPI001C943EC0|nr:hypothetical protein [Edaphocola aurantiacus]
MNKKTFLIAAVTFTASCSQNKDVSPSGVAFEKEFLDHHLRDSLIERVINYGDPIAYKDLSGIYFRSGMEQEFTGYALRMANDYKSGEACYDVWALLSSKKDESMNNALANYYLLRAAELKSEQATYTIRKVFGKDSVPSSSEYLKQSFK